MPPTAAAATNTSRRPLPASSRPPSPPSTPTHPQPRSCSHGDIDLSTDALEAATGFDWDRKPVTWSFCGCGGDDGGDDGADGADARASSDNGGDNSGDRSGSSDGEEKPRKQKGGKKGRKHRKSADDSQDN